MTGFDPGDVGGSSKGSGEPDGEPPTCLLSFSGGLDSLAAIGVLKRWGYDITLGHVAWMIEGSEFGELQSAAAYRLARELNLRLLVLAHVFIPKVSYAKYSWVPVCISTIIHHAGDPCVYPADRAKRYDAVAFGCDFLESSEYDNSIRGGWLQAMLDYTYSGEVLYPLEGILTRAGRRALVPPALAEMTVSCYEGNRGHPCGECWKCTA